MQSMRAGDTELELLRREVSCAALLEHWPAGWRLDRRESSRRSLKYRRDEGEILIINHGGHGWWVPQSSAKGDIFDLVQHLDPSLNFGQVRKELRRLVGVAPTFPEALRPSHSDGPVRPWKRRPRLRGPSYKGSLRGGTKTLFRFGRAGQGRGSVSLPSPRRRSTH
jgi:hypothetical protein